MNGPALDIQQIFNNIDFNTPKGWERIEKYAQEVLGPRGYKVECNEQTNQRTEQIKDPDFVAILLTWIETGAQSLLVISGYVSATIGIGLYPRVKNMKYPTWKESISYTPGDLFIQNGQVHRIEGETK